jgi:signal transduction histidine kinase
MSATPTATEKQAFSFENLSAQHIRLGVLVGLLSIATIITLIYLITAINWRNQPFLGVTLNHTFTVNASSPNSDAEWVGQVAGLRVGDQISSINGIPVRTSSRSYNDVLQTLNIGDNVTIEFSYDSNRFPALRSGAVDCVDANETIVNCQVSFNLMRLPDTDFVAFFVIPYLSGVIILIFAGILVFLKPYGEHTFTITVALIPLALTMSGIFDVGSTHNFGILWLGSMVFTGVTMITIGITFPYPIPAIRNQPLFRFIPAGLGVLLVIYITIAYNTERSNPLPIIYQVATLTAIFGLGIMATLIGAYHRRVAFTRRYRDQANVVMLGALLGLAPALLWLGGRFLPEGSPLVLSIEASLPFLITPALSLVYAVLQPSQFDTDKAVNQSITYFILFVTLGIGYALLVLGATLFANDVIQPDNPLLIVLTIFIVSVLFVPVRTNLQQRIDKIYYKVRYNYQNKLEAFNQKLTSLAGPNVLIKEFRQLLDETIQPFNTLIFLRNAQTGDYIAYGEPYPETDITFSEDSGVVRLLNNRDDVVYLEPNKPWPPELHIDKARLGIIRVMIIAGIAGESALNGFVAIAPPRSGASGYRYEELRFVRSLVGALSIAIERASVIESLERSVKELEVLSQVSQAVNFTVDTQDLLELISAQTLRLVGSPFFYIVLKDNVTNTLYYAFFQEDDERRIELENHKWQMGQDLYSEVIQTGQSLRVDNYYQTMERKGYKITRESISTSAWMAVPLVAGGATLGVMAVGEKSPEARYTSEQLRIMNDISALAASALDKSRLFSEANSRARQLAALNDISRQLVATEGDVERLLDVITLSAVDILNAQAGSLLLTAEDGSGELEFKVATGETGQELIGKRLSKGFGLVGRVAESGQPIISNDTTQDENWEGEVSEGFRTQSILAVPLIAQDRVIGVLEVINKVDGSIYVEEDVELLTTFAGQAAIAFENARLFQQTDLQLSRRVLELEALERIDRELNRSLDLYSVAEITVRYAISNSNASAGLLGVPDENPNYLRIVAKQGYEESDIPTGTDGNLWPVTSGIVSRVLRTRRPDLQPYVDMDPDYTPSLQGALSQITVPMIAGNEISAILLLESNQEPRLNLLDQDWIQRLAEHASIAIENAKLYEELTRANETKSEFIGFAAHELKNPLTSVKGYASTMGSSMVTALTPDQIKQFAAIIQNNAERMDSIISDLRDIARDDAGKLSIDVEPVELRQVTMDTLISLQKQIDSKGQIVINNITDALPPVLGDRMRLTQVMVNFLSNAHKYSPEGATIRLDAKVEPRFINQRGQNIGKVLQVSITDSGIGMSENTLSKLFKEDYFRSDNKQARDQEGTGLGMIITKRLIEGHNGDVWVESELGKGSTFHFVVPVAPPNKVETQENEIPESEASD